MQKLDFQTIFLIIFGIGALIGFALFATSGSQGGGGRNAGPSGAIVVWGTLPQEGMAPLITTIDDLYPNLSVSYIQKDAQTFDRELLRALAEGRGPDLFFVTDETLLAHRNKLFAIPFESYPPETVRETFIDQAEMLVDTEGVLGFPIMVDPMVMYVNRDILASSFVVDPPVFWDEFFALAPRIVQKNDAGALRQSLVAMGTFANITHGTDVLELIMLQAGNPLVGRNEAREPVVVFQEGGVAASAVRFYTTFSNPAQPAYSWSTAQKNDQDAFIEGTLALYFGYASEARLLRERNPNLNFDVRMMPQMRDTQLRATSGRLTFVGISRMSQNIPGAYLVAQQFAQPFAGAYLRDQFFVPPVQRSLLRETPTDPLWLMFYNSAISARSWPDPDPQATRELWRAVIQDTASGRVRVDDAIRRMHAGLVQLLP
ncbi:MAG: ABC transporter substrate-binding protein [Candidatus Pacebacteria bacterium]|nr:ABC transporter substrate-binding protein [Candidatus Paceibacterota bacterium]MCD8508217.1 ABC transporter substrate-binding protein [Candidatus Paceibacterota bacterium]MCD8527968.1 ABC transporter substrate-binding protein [Candidatus Paceibacterota bacterium]MCD8563581.1 ABC transporter substrate-binding protein [Candidatus Paceibacterota bacterium]